MKSILSFILFLTVFLLLYGLLHYYFYRKWISAAMVDLQYSRLVLIFLFVMLISPILINISAKSENNSLTTILAYIGYTWMGALFLFFSMHLLIDIYNGIIQFFSGTFFPVLSKVKLENKVSFVITGLIVVGIIIYGTFEASRIKVEKLVLKTEKLPSKISSLRVAQVSDIHFSAINSERMARKIVDKIRALNPDILVSTGDFIDRGLKDKESVGALFRGLKIPYGKYAVTGNHEFYAGIEWAVQFTKKAGFRMLRNNGITASGVVNIAGVDDPSAKHYGPEASVSEDEILKKLPSTKLTILLKHQPRINKKSVGAFDLQLSGHTHNGQIFPFSLITSLFFPYHNGLFKVGRYSYLYVSRGTGTWGPAVRFLSPPEITLIEFQRKAPSF